MMDDGCQGPHCDEECDGAGGHRTGHDDDDDDGDGGDDA